MIKQRKSSYQHRSNKKKRSQNIIHTTIRSRRNLKSTNSHLNLIRYKKQNDSLSNKSLSTKIDHLTRSFKVVHHEDIIPNYSQNIKNDSKDLTNDYHKKLKRKKKCSRRYFIFSLLTILLIILIITIILLVLLIKPKTKTNSTLYILRWNTTGITVAGQNGNSGNASNQLNQPTDAIVDYANNLYIADRLNHRIQKYLFGNSFGQMVAGNGRSGLNPNQLNNPSQVILDSNENMYISDAYNHRIQLWRKGANSGSTIAGTGTAGNASNQLRTPYRITLHPTTNTFYISDYGNHRIMSYTFNINNGTLILGDNGSGCNNTQLNNPIGLNFDLFSNSLIIANHVCNNIVRYVMNSTNWTLITGSINSLSGSISTQFNRPTDVIFDPMGNMYVADRNNHRIQFFQKDQFNGSTIAGITGRNGNNATTFDRPWSVRLDSQLNLYVADLSNHRIQKFLRY